MKTKKIVFCIMCCFALLMSTFVPVFASNVTSVTVVITNNSYTYTYTHTHSGGIDSLLIRYTSSNSVLQVEAYGNMDTTIVYQTFVPNGVAYNIGFITDQGNDLDHIYTQSSTDYQYSYSVPSNATSIELDVDIGNSAAGGYDQGYSDGVQYVQDHPEQYHLYTQNQYNGYGYQQYLSGISYVRNNPHTYQLKTDAEYNEWGDTRFNDGYKDGYKDGQKAASEPGHSYNDGYQDGLKDGKTFVGTTNVVLSNIFNVFTNFVNNTGIFGVTLISILVTGIIIIIVYVIFKAVRS